MESAPGSSIQSLPKLLKNQEGPNFCDAACEHLPSNGFILCRQPLSEQTTFMHDSFDEDIRRPLVQMMAHIEASEIPMDGVEIAVTHHLDELD